MSHVPFFSLFCLTIIKLSIQYRRIVKISKYVKSFHPFVLRGIWPSFELTCLTLSLHSMANPTTETQILLVIPYLCVVVQRCVCSKEAPLNTLFVLGKISSPLHAAGHEPALVIQESKNNSKSKSLPCVVAC